MFSAALFVDVAPYHSPAVVKSMVLAASAVLFSLNIYAAIPQKLKETIEDNCLN